MKKLLLSVLSLLLVGIFSTSLIGCGSEGNTGKLLTTDTQSNAISSLSSKDESKKGDIAIVNKSVAKKSIEKSKTVEILNESTFSYDVGEFVFGCKKGSDLINYVNYAMYTEKDSQYIKDIIANYSLTTCEIPVVSDPGDPEEETALYKIQETGKIKIGYVTEDYYAIEKLNVQVLMETQGFAVEYLKQLVLAIDDTLQIEYVVANNETELKTKLNNGEIDVVCGNFTKTDARSSDYALSNAYAKDIYVLVARKGEAQNYSSVSDVKKATVVVVAGSQGETIYNTQINK